MGSYTDYYVRAQIAPEYVALVRTFIETGKWPDSPPAFIQKWRAYLARISRYECDEYTYTPPIACPGIWGFHNNLNESDAVWTIAGTIKNYKHQIQVFLTKVLVPLSIKIEECRISTEMARDCCKPSYFDSDEEDDNHIRYLCDEEIRHSSWRMTF